jgi:hypothetical protein
LLIILAVRYRPKKQKNWTTKLGNLFDKEKVSRIVKGKFAVLEM